MAAGNVTRCPAMSGTVIGPAESAGSIAATYATVLKREYSLLGSPSEVVSIA